MASPDIVRLAAEAALATTHDDSIVLDLRLPDGDGIDVLKALRGPRNPDPGSVVHLTVA